MPYTLDIGGAPATEDCAQLGQTPDFEAINSLEVIAYKLALIARHGLPPAGCKFVVVSNRHDFGTYRELGLRVDEDSEDVARYADAVEEGLATWIEAGFTAPVTYHGKTATIQKSDHAEIVIGALLTTRPSKDGSFPVPDFAVLHANLASAFPEQAATAMERLASS